jgi:hypothetical protein
MKGEIEKNRDIKISVKKEGKQNSSRPTVESVDKAFEWLVLVQTVLISIIFQVLTWITKPEINYKVIAQLMFSLTMPLVVLIITWFGQLITSKIFLRLFSWGMLAMVFSYYTLLFFVLVFLGITTEFSLVVIGSFIVVSAVVVFFPSKRILRIYRTAAAPDNKFWKKHADIIWYIMGLIIASILILVPFLF